MNKFERPENNNDLKNDRRAQPPMREGMGIEETPEESEAKETADKLAAELEAAMNEKAGKAEPENKEDSDQKAA